MVTTARNGNPFRPGAGQMPPFLAGRERELATARRRLDELAGGVPPAQGLLLYGPRGNGKTVLLERIAAQARQRGLRAESFPADALRDRAVLIQELREHAGLTDARLSGVPIGPIGATAQRAVPTANISRLVAGWAEAVSASLVVVLDEIHTMDPEVGRAFFEAIQKAWSGRLPFLLIAAGTPDAPRAIRRAGTFAERAFERLPTGRLDPAATAAALARPLDVAGRPIADHGLSLLVGESQRYPYFIQILGSAAWDAAAGNEAGVSRQTAEQAVASARSVIERFYLDRFDEAREREVEDVLAPLARGVVGAGGRLADCDLGKLLTWAAGHESIPFDRASLRATLRDLGIIWETSSGGWELGIPSFADYVLRRTGELPRNP